MPVTLTQECTKCALVVLFFCAVFYISHISQNAKKFKLSLLSFSNFSDHIFHWKSLTRNRIFCSTVKFSKVLKENDIDINFSEHDEKYYTTNGMYCIKVVYSSHVGRVSAVAGKLLMTRRKSKTMPALQSIYEMDKPCNFSCFFYCDDKCVFCCLGLESSQYV